ncbi:armadillo-type protein [Polychytrium aggregatum]|uniref:armadillo-type protein n=1 Tax=Polychytrium aggregatum TaxID=110093 RepID=UPI0022FE9070|nr:armadillo-type protein [Polychytrium aggregatum]KAI9205283.1 armadillo-type protein [Polychytrium aggregatum]
MTIADIDPLEFAKSDPATYSRLEETLLNSSGSVALHQRFRALFTLKSFKTDQAVDIIAKGFSDSSILFKHELAYVLGQMKNPHAIKDLVAVLSNTTEAPMVRHEAAEALGAISDTAALETLIRFKEDESRVVRETIELAIEKIQYDEKKRQGLISEDVSNSLYTSIDPAPPVTEQGQSVEELRKALMDASLPLFERYRAMFALRNRGDTDAVLALAEGLEDESALFRHEIAYVFGQMQHPASVPALVKSLSKTTEESMVRHECAEALGSIATPEVFPVLKQFSQDPERVVRESCIVGLDMYEYETSGAFQYADGLSS